ncbi:MAG: hypothetical protein Q7Q73_11115 [Verrucomicrobiota bacterium JB024]|nr:hypothetical protein [Verrucomicrobiota bacterium JB024]
MSKYLKALQSLQAATEQERETILSGLVNDHYDGAVNGLTVTDIIVETNYASAMVWIMEFGEPNYHDGATDDQDENGDSFDYPENEKRFLLELTKEGMKLDKE